MSIDNLKKQAKTLRKLLPDFVQENSANPSLAACQELIARCSGYPSWHAAVKARESSSSEDPWDRALRQLRATLSAHLSWEATRGDSDSEQALRDGVTSVRMELKPGSSLSDPEDQLDAFLERHTLDDTGPSAPSTTVLRELATLCERQVADAVWFVDGHAHLVSALTRLGKPKEAFSHGRPVLDALIEMLPGGTDFSGRISWYELSNRPFHRLAFNLVAAYMANHEEGEGFRLRAEELVAQFSRWSPNDNIGMRQLISPKRPGR